MASDEAIWDLEGWVDQFLFDYSSSPPQIDIMRRASVDELVQMVIMGRAELNRHTKVGRIPPEVLVEIFHATLALDTRPTVLEQNPHSNAPVAVSQPSPDLKTLLTIASVCIQWRNVVINCSTLWRHVSWRYTQDRSLLQLYLQRCPSAPVHSLQMDHMESTLHMIRQLSEYASGLHTLDLRFLPEKFPDSEYALKVTMPHLRCLVLRGDETEAGMRTDQATEILNGCSSSLEAYCHVQGYAVTPSNHLPNLTHLLLDVRSYNNLTEFDGVVELLRRTPLLQCFTLHNVHIKAPLTFAPETRADAKVHLDFLRRFALPKNGHMLISGPNVENQIRPNDFVNIVQQCAPPPYGSGSDSYIALDISIIVCNVSFVFVLERPTSGLFFQTSLRQKSTQTHPFFRRISSLVPQHSVRTLRLAVDTSSSTGLERTFHLQTHLRNLQLVFLPSECREGSLSQTIQSLCDVLAARMSHSPDPPYSTPRGTTACPRLSHLSISADFEDEQTLEKCVTALAAMLSSRVDADIALRSLAIQCLITRTPPPPRRIYRSLLVAQEWAAAASQKLADVLARHVGEYVSVAPTDRAFCTFDVGDAWRDHSLEDKYWKSGRTGEIPLPEFDFFWG